MGALSLSHTFLFATVHLHDVFQLNLHLTYVSIPFDLHQYKKSVQISPNSKLNQFFKLSLIL